MLPKRQVEQCSISRPAGQKLFMTATIYYTSRTRQRQRKRLTCQIPGVTTPANPVSSLATVSSSGIEQAEEDMPDIQEEENGVGDDMEL